MSDTKKSHEKFLQDVIVPVEQNKSGSKNLFVLVEARLELDISDFREEDVFLRQERHWSSFPTDSNPGKWIEHKKIRLETISGILWHSPIGGRLYRIEYQGDSIELERSDYIHSFPKTDYQKMLVETQEYIDSCIFFGVKVKKAKLIARVKHWTPYFLWSFAIDCTERAYEVAKESIPEVYKEGIVFARAYSKYVCKMGSFEIKDLLSKITDDDIDKFFVDDKRQEMINKITHKTEYGSSSRMQKMIRELLLPYNFFEPVNKARTLMSEILLAEYDKEYDLPSPISNDLEEKIAAERIWIAIHKKELDWQVMHMEKLLGI